MRGDNVYENQIVQAGHEFEDEESEPSLVDKFFSIWDFLVQMNVFMIMLLNILYKFGISDYMAPGSSMYLFLKHMGLTKNISLVSIFALSHINQSKYIGVSKVDSFQYVMIRVLPLALQFLIIVRSDYVGTLKYHFEQLLFVLFYLAYFLFADFKKSRENRLGQMFDEALNDQDEGSY